MGLASSSTNRVFAVGGGWTANSGRTGSGRGDGGGEGNCVFWGGREEGRGKEGGGGLVLLSDTPCGQLGVFWGGDFLGG